MTKRSYVYPIDISNHNSAYIIKIYFPPTIGYVIGDWFFLLLVMLSSHTLSSVSVVKNLMNYSLELDCREPDFSGLEWACVVVALTGTVGSQ